MKLTIVCGVDFSRQSATALEYAAALARAWSAEVCVVHAVDPLLKAAAAFENTALDASVKTDLARFVRRALGSGRTQSVRSVVRTGRAADVVLAEARRRSPSVIVMGTHGLRGVARLAFGSVAEAVVRRAHGPVLVIPRRCRHPGMLLADTRRGHSSGGGPLSSRFAAASARSSF